MQLLQAPKHLLKRASSTCHAPQGLELSTQDCSAHRHDAQMITTRRVSADPYKVWLEQREANRAREAHRLNPRNAWDDLRTQTFCGVGRI